MFIYRIEYYFCLQSICIKKIYFEKERERERKSATSKLKTAAYTFMEEERSIFEKNHRNISLSSIDPFIYFFSFEK